MRQTINALGKLPEESIPAEAKEERLVAHATAGLRNRSRPVYVVSSRRGKSYMLKLLRPVLRLIVKILQWLEKKV